MYMCTYVGRCERCVEMTKSMPHVKVYASYIYICIYTYIYTYIYIYIYYL